MILVEPVEGVKNPAAAPARSPQGWLTERERAVWLRRSTGQALAILVPEYIAYFAFVALAIAPLPVVFNIAGGVLASLAIGVIFTVGHDACHQSLTPSAGWNRWLGRIAFIPSAQAVSLWILEHNRIHHGSTNLRGKDYVLEPMSPADYAAASALRRWFYRLTRSRVGSLPYYLVHMWWEKNFLPIAPEARPDWHRHLPDSVFVVAAQLLFVAAVVAIDHDWAPERAWWNALLCGWVLPFLVWNWLIGLIIYCHHTHPEVPWFAAAADGEPVRSQIIGTVHVRLPSPFHLFDNNIMEHSAHHAVPTIPMYHLFSAQRKVREVFPEIRFVALNPARYCAMTDACKLYDCDAARWVDFSGRPTGPVLFPKASAA
jgi:omega-6 fatty acid desaturase (delta-12 desaturase)